MRDTGKVFGALLVVALAGCGGSLNPSDGGGGSGGAGGSSNGGFGGSSLGGAGGTTGSGGATPTGPCSSLSGCECLAASDRCVPRS